MAKSTDVGARYLQVSDGVIHPRFHPIEAIIHMITRLQDRFLRRVD